MDPPIVPTPTAQRGTVCAVVVSHDRAPLLAECLEALLAQERAVDEIVVVDNASSDGSAGMVAERFPAVTLIGLQENVGGAGGFYAGMSAAFQRGHEWLWLMDDDTIATPSALAELLRPLDGLPAPLVLASKVVWRDASLHPKNMPNPRITGAYTETFVDAAERGLILIRNASFVSILIHRTAIERHGLPHRHYFIWGDDYEYTGRLLRDAPGYLVPTSLVHHKTAAKESVHVHGSGRYYYEVRNKLFMLRGDSFTGREKVFIVVALLMGIQQYLSAERLRPSAWRVLVRALRDGLVQPAV